MEDGLFPHQRSSEEPGRLQEERRLCYVGITRARQQLVLTCAERRRLYGKDHYPLPSMFIGEIPKEYIQDIRPKVNTSAVNHSSGMFNQYKSEEPAGEFSIGQRVHHHKFGEGMVTNYEGQGSHARVEVNFSHAGSKWLVLSYANLQAL